jgi:hypothetical protein
LTKVEHKKSSGDYEDILSLCDEEDIEIGTVITKKILNDWIRGLKEDRQNCNYREYRELKKLFTKAELSEKEKKLVDLRHGLSGAAYTWREIAAIISCSTTMAQIRYGQALRKIIIASRIDDNLLFELQECERNWKKLIVNLGYHTDMILAYYNFSGSTSNLQIKSDKKTCEVIRTFRRKIIRLEESLRLLLKTRETLLSVLKTIDLKPLELKIISDFYCLDGIWRDYKKSSSKSYFYLWKIQQKFKASLKSYTNLNLFELSRDLSFTYCRKKGRKEVKENEKVYGDINSYDSFSCSC